MGLGRGKVRGIWKRSILMTAVSRARIRIRIYFFRKITVLELRLELLKQYVISALCSILAWSTRSLKRTSMEYGVPQRRESVKESGLQGDFVSRSIRELKPDYTGSMDYENQVLHECPVCESNLWNIKATFDDYEIAMYCLDMECSVCGTYAKAPTLLDK